MSIFIDFQKPIPKWEPMEQWQPETPTADYSEFLKPPEYAPTPWYQKTIGKATAPFRWLHEKVEVPGAAIVLSGVTPEIPRQPEESWSEWEKRQYEAYKAPKFVKGVTEFAISLPLFLIPYGGISVASSKALASVAAKAGMVNSAKVVMGLGEIIPAVERLMGLPFRVAGREVRQVVARKVPLEVLPMEQISHQIGDIVLPSVAAMAKKVVEKEYVWAVKDRFKPLEWIINKVDPSILAVTPEARLTIGFNRVLDVADAAATFQVAPLIAKGGTAVVKDLFGLDDLMRATKVTPVTTKVTDIVFGVDIPSATVSKSKGWLQELPPTALPVKQILVNAKRVDAVNPTARAIHLPTSKAIIFRDVQALETKETFFHELGHSIFQSLSREERVAFGQVHSQVPKLLVGSIYSPEKGRVALEESFARAFGYRLALPKQLAKEAPKVASFFERYFPKKVTPKTPGLALDMDSIARFPGRYNLTGEQAEWLKVHRQVMQPIRDELKRMGMLERELAFEEGEGGYLGRLLTKFVDPLTKKETEIRSGSLFTMGAKPQPKPRIIEDYNKALELGYRYADPLTTTAYRIRQALYALANKDYVEAMMGLPGVRTIGAKALPERIIRDAAQEAAQDTSFVLARLRRMSRGEKLTPQSLRAIEGKNPEIAGLLGTNPSSQELEAAIRHLNNQLGQERILAKNAAEKASLKLAQTRRPALMTEGTVYPIPGLRNQIVPKKVADYINRELGTSQNKWIGSMSSAQGVVRMLQTGIDLGPYFLQGMPTMITDPKIWAKTVKSSMEVLFGDEATIAKLLSQPIHRDTLAKIIPHGFTLNGAEFVEAAPILAKLPFVGGTFTRWARWFNSALDLGRLYQIEAMMMLPSVKQAGDAGLRALVDHMGKRWGVMSTRWLGIPAGQRQVENALLFYASRWTRSGFAIMKDALTRGGMEGVLARDMVGRMMFGMTAMYYGICKALGQEPNLDPSTGKFMTVQLGTDHVGFGGMYIALARFGGNTLRTLSENPQGFTTLDSRDNPFLRFARGRVAPLTGASIDIITGKTFLGEPVDSFPNFGKHVAIRNLTPFWVAGWLGGLVGTQPMPSGGAPAEFFGMRTWPLQPWERRDDLRETYAQTEFSKPWAELKVLDRRKLEDKHSDLKDITEQAWLESIKRGRPSRVVYGQWREERDAVNAKYEEGLWELQERVDKGEIIGYDFRLSAQKLGVARGFALDRIDERPEYKDVMAALNEPRLEPKVTPQFEDVAYDIYTKLMFSGDLEIGITEYNFEEADKRKQRFITTFGQEIYDYVLNRMMVGRNVPPLMTEYYKAKEVMRPYWEVRDFAERYYGKPQTKAQELRIDRLVSRLRKNLRRQNPEIERYYQMFYVRA